MNTSRTERFENAEKSFFDLKPRGEKKTPKISEMQTNQDEGTDNEETTDDDKLLQLRKVIEGRTKDRGYNVIQRRRKWKESGGAVKAHSPAFMKRMNSSLDIFDEQGYEGISKCNPGRIAKFRNKLYASNPALDDYRRTTEAMGGSKYASKNRSMPSKMHLLSSHPSIYLPHPKARMFPKISNIQPHNVLFSDDVLGNEAVEEITYEKEEDEAEAGDYDEAEMASTYAPSSTGTGAIKADWLLEESLKSEMKKFERQQKSLMIKVDDDTILSLEKRMDEIVSMVRPRKDPRKVIDRVPPEIKVIILKVKSIPLAEIKRNKRKKWKLLDLFKWSVSMVTFLLRCFWNRKKYYIDKSNMGQLRRKIEKEMKAANQSLTPTSKSSIPAHLETALRTMPHFRDKQCVAHVLWLLRTTKAFKALFPAEMEEELARNVSYEKYDDGRILAYQSRTPDRFYYVLAGRANVVRQFRLSQGQVTKHMGFLTKGNTTDPEEMERQWMREDSLVAKGQVEVLILERTAFDYLQTTHQGPPVDFIKTVDIFESFNPEVFLSHPDAIEYKYYGQGKLIVRDSNRTQWLHLVKSGNVKVVRKQSVLDSVASNGSKFSSKHMDELGCGKYPSHAQAMLGGQARQKKLQELRTSISEISAAQRVINIVNAVQKSKSAPVVEIIHPLVREETMLPEIKPSRTIQLSKPYDLDTYGDRNPFAATLGIELDPVDESNNDAENKPIKKPVIFRASARTHLKHFESKRSNSVQSKMSRPSTVARPEVADIDELTDDSEDDDGDSLVLSGSIKKQKKRRPSGTKLPAINIPTRLSTTPGSDEDFANMQNMWLTKEKTESVFPKKEKEPQKRRTYLQLDMLKPGDVFGLDHLQSALASEPHGYSLVSDGAEIVKISKRFFLQYASNNSMMKVETMFKHYLSEDDATERLYEKETWDQYKTALWGRMTDGMQPPNTVR